MYSAQFDLYLNDPEVAPAFTQQAHFFCCVGFPALQIAFEAAVVAACTSRGITARLLVLRHQSFQGANNNTSWWAYGCAGYLCKILHGTHTAFIHHGRRCLLSKSSPCARPQHLQSAYYPTDKPQYGHTGRKQG